jgi:hypothetical protein
MATRSRRRAGARGASGIKQSLNEAQRAVGGYVRSGSKQVNDAVSTFLSKFDTGHLLDALRKKTTGGGRRSSTRRTATARRSASRRTTGRKRRSAPKVRRAAARKTTATRRSTRRK